MNATFLVALSASIVAAFGVVYVVLEHSVGPRLRARERARITAVIMQRALEGL